MPAFPSGPETRLYAILDCDLTAVRGLSPLDLVNAWLAAGVRLIQLRAKSLASGPMLELADVMNETIRAAGGCFIVNDRVDVACMSGASGVHVGQTDLAAVDARRLVGESVLVGVSTHNRRQVDAALDQPVDYLAIGPVFGTTTKERPDPIVGIAGVGEAVSLARKMPVVAIGGITLESGPRVLEAGAAAVAVIADLLVGDVERRALAFLAALR